MFILLTQSAVQINALGLIKIESINPKYFRNKLTVSKMKTRTVTIGKIKDDLLNINAFNYAHYILYSLNTSFFTFFL
jgi:hypothetical protein